MNISFQFKSLEISRYRVTYHCNEDARLSGIGMGILDPPSMSITYKELISRQKQLHSPDSQSPGGGSGTSQVMRNQISTLHSFLALSGKTVDSIVGRELLGDFDAKLRSYTETLSLSEHTKADRRSHLRAWRATAQALLAEQRLSAAPDGEHRIAESDFHEKLRHALATSDQSPSEIARRAGASEQAVRRWLKGAIPNTRAMPSLRRLELELGLEPDALRRLLPKQRDPRCFPAQKELPVDIPYRARQKERTADRYRLKLRDINPSLAAEWRALLEYKTTKRTTIERSKRGKWRLLPKQKVAGRISMHAQKGNLLCETAQLNLDQFRAFAGYLSRPRTAGGFGLALDAVQTVAWLAVPEAVNGYLEFLTARSDGIAHAGHVKLANLASSLTHPVTGYLTQQPQFAERLPSAYVSIDWTEMCKATHTLCADWKQDSTGISRDPSVPIQKLLDLAEPFAPVLKAIEFLDLAAASSPPGSLTEAIHKRDALLLAMLMANPLRRRNWVLMTWNEDNAGVLYQRQDRQWRIRYGAAEDFKNEGTSSSKGYDAPLPRALQDRIEDYLAEYRPRLIRNALSAAFLFPSNTGTKWVGLARHVTKLTRRLIPETPFGFGPHAFRHLVATDYLRKHPNDFLTVAILLHDTLETVLRAYAHLRQDESFEKYEAHIQAISH
jgi:integrase/transcriptional regulator with XRE-family HTH domain